jgi:hypothetical protein
MKLLQAHDGKKLALFLIASLRDNASYWFSTIGVTLGKAVNSSTTPLSLSLLGERALDEDLTNVRFS